LVEHSLQTQQLDELIEGALVAPCLNAIDISQQREAIDYRKIPPELRALPEHDADARDVAPAVIEWNEPVDFDPT
jgi:hypothetical protein